MSTIPIYKCYQCGRIFETGFEFLNHECKSEWETESEEIDFGPGYDRYGSLD